MAGYVIHIAPGLSPEEVADAVRAGPPEVRAVGSPAIEARQAGFETVEQRDATSEFLATCRALLEARALHERAVRQECGDEGFAEEHEKTVGMIEAIERGLLRRSLILAREAARS